MSVNLYDVLGVDEGASRDEIRTAWKDLTADLDPTDRRFRALNEAAAVLLDPDKRAAYDGELAAADSEPVAEAWPVVEPAPIMAESESESEPEPEPEPEPDSTATTGATVEVGATAVADADADRPSRAVVIAAAIGALLAVAALVVTWFATAPESERASGGDGVSSAADPTTREIIDAVTEMTPAVLGYDYRTLDADIERARDYMTAEKGDEYEQLLVTNREAIEQQKLVVSAVANNVGVSSIAENGSSATALIFVDQESRQGDAQPRILEMWASLRLVRQGDEWLVEEICTERDCGAPSGE